MTPRLALVLLVLGGASSVRAEDFGEPLSLQGFSGGLNTPTAWVHASGTAHFLVTDQAEPQNRDALHTTTFLLSASPLQFFEAGVRMTDANFPARSFLRDLSLNAKVQLPLALLWPDSPVAVAVGAQDFAGSVPFFRTRYAVASGRWRWFGGSVGYGLGPDRMKGVFGSGELRPLPNVHLLAEYDGAEWNAGARVLLPAEIASVPFQVGVTAKTSLSHSPGFLEWGVTAAAPLDLGTRRDEGPVEVTSSAFPMSESRSLEALQKALVDFGFEEVRVGSDGTTVLVEYENNIVDHSELDGLGVVLGYLAYLVPDRFSEFSVTTLRRQVPLVETCGPVASLESYFGARQPGIDPPFVDTVVFTIRPNRRTGTFISSTTNSSNWRAQLAITPGIRPFIGTEVGVFDAVLSVRPEATVALWRGAAVYARWDVPVAWTKNLDKGEPLYQLRGGPRLDYGLLYQAIPIAKGLTALVGAGVFRVTAAGATGQFLWTPGEGSHAFGLNGAFARTNQAENRPSLTATYRYTFAPLEAVLQLEAGQFYEGDRGVLLQASRYFGDVQVGAFYGRTDRAILGVFATLPLTPRKEMKPGLVQLRGARRWETDIYTTVQEPEGGNRLRIGFVIPPVSPFNLETVFLDGSRLTVAELRKGLPRARLAFQQLRVPVVDQASK